MFESTFSKIGVARLEYLKSFFEQYIEMSEILVNFDISSMEAIDSAEKSVNMKALMGELPVKFRGMSESQIKLYFMRERVKVIEKTLHDNPDLRKVCSNLYAFLRKHRAECQEFKLIGSDHVMTASETYANYYYCQQYLDIVKRKLELKNFYKK